MEQHRTLACIAEGESVRVRSLEMGGILRRRLSDLGLIPGTEVTCVRRGNGLAAYRIFKDADALDRVRLGDLNPAMLRTQSARGMVDFAEGLYRDSLAEA